MAEKLFVSYSRRDFPFVRDLVRSLRIAGVDLWLDVVNLSGGERWNSRIEAALKACSHCLVVVSPYSMKSAEVAREIEVADQFQKEIIPLLLQTANLSERLRTIEWIDFRVTYEKALSILIARLRGEAPTTTEEWLDAPPRPLRFMGFVPLLYIVCPRAVKTISTLIFFSGGVRIFAGLACFSYIGGEDAIVIGSIVSLWTAFAMWWAFRAANRRATLGEVVAFQSMTVVIPFFGLAADKPLLLFLVTMPLDLALLIAIVASKTYRRWMPAYPSWSK